MTLMAAFLARTKHLKMGAAAVLLGFHEPLAISEQIATLSALYPNRVLMGFAKGGPFESQNKAFNITGDVSRAKMLEALPAMRAVLSQDNVSHQGDFYQWKISKCNLNRREICHFLLPVVTSVPFNWRQKKNMG
jgi:alkanesulfonate monooxygenase SsuD/methylene tetrahydromethanopterin reductase-like flavin-dependent oxidoreductase (luciferase family)